MRTSFSASCVSLAIQAVLDDPGFNIPSPLAVNAVQTAKQLLEWSQSLENRASFDEFALQLVSELEALFSLSGGHKRQREKMWGQYHLTRSSKAFTERWFRILQPLHGHTPCPVFYQYVTDNVFKQLIKHHCSASQQPCDTHMGRILHTRRQVR